MKQTYTGAIRCSSRDGHRDSDISRKRRKYMSKRRRHGATFERRLFGKRIGERDYAQRVSSYLVLDC